VNRFHRFQHYFHHQKYRNNLDYYKSIILINRAEYVDGGFFIMQPNTAISSPVSVIYYENYQDIKHVVDDLNARKDQIQCVVSASESYDNFVKPGNTQFPALDSYADNLNTLVFLLEKN
ncbi:MAG: hypothetical protein JW731_13430, partial [Bacteroidales bacterium]|nr:hypothetical protein [Bacteroidales bacterium]